MDYERSNFSISQCRFEDDISMDLVAIPPATETPSHLRRNVAIGTSIGAASFLLMVSLAAILTIRRWRRKPVVQHGREATEPPTPWQEPTASIDSCAQEIGHNSMVGSVRELPNNAKPKEELLNAQAPSGSGNQIAEMSDTLPSVLHELRTSRESHAMIQTCMANRCQIFMSTKVLRKSWPTFTSSDASSCVETVTSASTMGKHTNIDRESVVASNLKAEIYALYIRESFDVNKSLPPTPISESPQVSPIVAKFHERPKVREFPHIVETTARGSTSALMSPELHVSENLATFVKYQRFPVDASLTARETMTSPF